MTSIAVSLFLKVFQDFPCILSCSNIWYIYVYKGYILLLEYSLQYYVVTFFISCYGICFEVFLSDTSIFCPNLFSCPFSWNIFFHPFHFSLCGSFVQKWVSCRQHICNSCFLIHSANLCLLTGTFNITFKVMIDRYLFIAIFPLCTCICLSLSLFIF